MLTILTLNILLMIVYLSHWDWNLYKSRKDIVSSLNNKNISSVCPINEYKNDLNKIYKNNIDWDLDRRKLLDIKGIINLIKILNKIESNSIIHVFTLKSGVLYSIANIFTKNNLNSVLSINGLGYIFSKNKKAICIKFLLSLFINKLFNKSFKTIIFQNNNDKETFKNFSKFEGNTILIPGSGLETNNYILKDNYNKENLKVIFVGRLLIDKGVKEYINLANKIKNKNIKFYLAGEIDTGNPNSITELELNEINLNKKIEYIGLLDVEDNLKSFDISIVMSKYEGFSRILLESLYVGLFCISNDIPGTEWLNDFKNGELVKYNNLDNYSEILNNFNNYEFSKRNAEENRLLINKNFSSKIISEQYNEVYNNLKK